MAQINMDRRQSFLLNDIKQVIGQGGNVTHILNVKVSNPPSPDEGNRIRAAIYRSIANTPIHKVVNAQAITLRWRTSATTTSAYYHCDAGFFNDKAVKEHTKKLLRDLLISLDPQFNNIFLNGTTGVAFKVTKPLVREVVLVDDDDEENDDEVLKEQDKALE
eukprot:gene14050-15522_t